MDTASVADAGSGERHTGCKRLIRLFKGHEAFMPIGRMVGPLRDGRNRQFFDGGVLLDLNDADRAVAFALNEDVDVLHAAHTCPMWAIAFLDRQRLDTRRSPRPTSSIVESHRKRKWRRSRERELRLHA
jgi:hypothetical protein